MLQWHSLYIYHLEHTGTSGGYIPGSQTVDQGHGILNLPLLSDCFPVTWHQFSPPTSTVGTLLCQPVYTFPLIPLYRGDLIFKFTHWDLENPSPSTGLHISKPPYSLQSPPSPNLCAANGRGLSTFLWSPGVFPWGELSNNQNKPNHKKNVWWELS